jgi:hypothetical protein
MGSTAGTSPGATREDGVMVRRGAYAVSGLVSEDVARVVVLLGDRTEIVAHIADWKDGRVFGAFWRDDIDWVSIIAYDTEGNPLDQRDRHYRGEPPA